MAEEEEAKAAAACEEDEDDVEGNGVREEELGVPAGAAAEAEPLLVAVWAAAGLARDDGRHLTVTIPEGSERNHSLRCFIRSVCFWWT